MFLISVWIIISAIMLSVIIFILFGIPTLPMYDTFDFFDNK